MIREVQDYIDALPAKRADAFHYVRDRLLQIDDVIEAFDYSMPTYSIGKRKLFALASQKNHVSLYVMHVEVLDLVREELAGLSLGKSCVRFTKTEQIPIEILDTLVEESLKLL